MDEIDFEIDEDIKVSNIFKKFQNKNIFNDIIEDKIEEQKDSSSKDFENNLNNIYNKPKTLINTDDYFYIEDEYLNIESEDNNKSKKKEITTDTINVENMKNENHFNLEEYDLNYYKDNLKKTSYEELKNDYDNIYNINHLNFNDNENKDTLLQSKNNFDIGNIYNSDYNDETIIFNVSVDLKKDEFQKKEIENKEHINDNKDFYELKIDEMPNRKNLLEKIYEEDLSKSNEQNKFKNKKTKDIKILGKIFKRSEK